MALLRTEEPALLQQLERARWAFQLSWSDAGIGETRAVFHRFVESVGRAAKSSHFVSNAPELHTWTAADWCSCRMYQYCRKLFG